MKKSIKKITCLLLSAIAAFPLVSCKSEQSYDPETTPVVFATETLDGNFNPFFATSGGDSEMVSMTQIGMLSTDDKGNIAYGQDEPTVTLDFAIDEATDQSSTTYKFIIKNDIQFSDGKPLTIKDVLFNLYVYLDPAYMGSATMYSTDIKGLKKYRAQDTEMADDDDSENLDETFYAQAMQRRTDIIDYLEGTTTVKPENYDADIALIKQRFKEELESDWTMTAGTQESYKDEYTFTEDWQIFYFNEGIVKTYKVQGKPQKNAQGKYITNLDAAAGDYYNADIAATITAAANDATKIGAYTALGNSAEVAKQLVIKDTAIQTVYEANVEAGSDALASVLKYWATSVNILDDFAADARLEWYEEHKAADGSLAVKTISGIKTSKTTVDFNGNALGAEHDVLTIEINGIDPKAKYNFAFAVAPLHYYSGTYKNVNYIAEANGVDKFGVAFGDKTFFETILQADEKNKKPVGAGVYQVSNSKGDTGDAANGNDFYINNWVYFARNEYFKTVGSGLHNANINYLHYKVVNTENIVQSLDAGDIHVGEPNATTENINALGNIEHVSFKTVRTNGYGYVGINPKYVPDIEVRRAIMMALNAVHCKTYYGSYASVIYRPMSLESWVWNYIDENATQRDRYYAQATTKAEIQAMVESGDSTWTLQDGKYYNDKGEPLKLTFTIAGATSDHPAYTMFDKAKELLNSAGFDITITTDVSALKKLATGQLEVWAAAWSSTVDPDMYQVYHKDSTATSVNNWGYPTILNDSTGQFTEEKNIINALSEQIELGRTTNDEATRAGYYKTALDYVMELAVEFPTYQRDDCVAYNSQIIDATSLNQNPTAFAGVIDRIWELRFL